MKTKVHLRRAFFYFIIFLEILAVEVVGLQVHIPVYASLRILRSTAGNYGD